MSHSDCYFKQRHEEREQELPLSFVSDVWTVQNVQVDHYLNDNDRQIFEEKLDYGSLLHYAFDLILIEPKSLQEERHEELLHNEVSLHVFRPDYQSYQLRNCHNEYQAFNQDQLYRP